MCDQIIPLAEFLGSLEGGWSSELVQATTQSLVKLGVENTVMLENVKDTDLSIKLFVLSLILLLRGHLL